MKYGLTRYALLATALLAISTLARADGELPGAEVEGYPACVRAIEATQTEVAFTPSTPATRSSRRILDTLAAVRSSLRETRYEHVTRVQARRGIYLWDCSGMAAWIMQHATPHALAALGKGRLVARDFYRAIARAPIGRARGGWQRLAGIADARPGDVITWLRPQGWSSPNTGHVAFVLEAPQQVPDHPGTWAIRIADATSFGHQNDTRGEGQGGYGEGTLLILTNKAGEAIAYGWYGTQSDAVLVTNILFGRIS